MAPKKPCHYFQFGKCDKGSKCTYAHVVDPNFKRRPCAHFAKGRCNRGNDCKFSHAQNDIDSLKLETNVRDASGTTDTTEAQFKRWRYSIPPDPRKSRKLGPTMGKFCQEALELVKGEPGLVQEVISLLASEGGMLRVAELLDQAFEKMSDAQLARVFDAQLLPFFRTITHRNVTASPILESRLITIYNYVYGSGGQRAVLVFTAVARHLSSLALCLEDGHPNEATISAHETGLAALSKLIEVNTTAQVNGGLPPIAEILATLLEEPQSKEITFAIRDAQKHLSRIEQRLGLGKALPSPEGSTKNLGGRSTFDLAKEMPGKLSEDDARHDNDHVDIREISILPTLQEIQSSRTEYLPLADPREWHLGGLEGLLDRNFRLLREDTVGQLRDAAKFELEALLTPQPSTDNKRQKRQGARTYVYDNVTISNAAFDPFNGLEFALSFDQPKNLDRRSNSQRRDWWQGSKRMAGEALICLLSSEGSVTFFVVSQEPRAKTKDDELEHLKTNLHKEYNLWSDPDRAHVVARMVSQDDTRSVFDQLLNNSGAQFSLVEFPGVLLPAFMPTLQAMQRMSTSLDVSFANILAPVSTPANPERDTVIQPPSYATKPGFQYDLSAITTDHTELRLAPGQDIAETARSLVANSTLDAAQAQALLSSLSRSLALIQGPPGTGKSFTGAQLTRVVLANKDVADLGPILCVTFTNHALDQQLERLVDEGVSQIIRIGGQSKSECLAEVNIRAVAQRMELTKTEKQDRWNLQAKIQEEAKEINRILGDMGQYTDQNSIQAHLQLRYPNHYDQLFTRVDEDGFTAVNYHPEKIVDTWVKGAPWVHGRARAVDELHDEHVINMSALERRMLYRSWLTEIRDELQDRLMFALHSYHELKAKLDLIRTELDLRVLRQANIIGITTSGLARNIDLLRRINVKVLLCEEAGEVLEAHLLTALLPSLDHAILIGDHRQLRPHVQNYDLSVESRNGGQYSLDISLFERLVEPNDILRQPLPYCSLEVQRRMHPSISELIRQTIYPRLQNAESVSEYPDVSGLKHRLFWMHHENPENETQDGQSTSHTNDFECEMTAALVSHLVKQGVYRSSEIAVLTPYLGQVRKLRKKLAGAFEIVLNDRDVEDLAKEGEADSDEEPPALPLPRANVARGTLLQAVRIATVDNFQGEEAKVIVLSLVRSNEKNNAGFLRTPNRINVLLSRAQHGMIILGNTKMTRHIKMWDEVIRILEDQNLIGDGLELCCPRHKDKLMIVQQPEDFLRLSPEAGCDLRCDRQLPCGHVDSSKCHSNMLHQAVFCIKPCTRPKEGCSHNCSLPCGATCHEHCLELVDNIDIELGCGHKKSSLPCYQHQDPSKILCDVAVERVVPGCGHKVTIPCCVDVDSEDFICPAMSCGAPLECGHVCGKPCSRCNTRENSKVVASDHGICKQRCGRQYSTCRHQCSSPACHGDSPCPSCEAACEVSCIHSKCDKKCSEPCVPCAEEHCGSRCSHSVCRMPCAAPCDWLPCTYYLVPINHLCQKLTAKLGSLRCSERLDCGCQCPSVCGEVCPSSKYCQNCASENIKSLTAEWIEFTPYGEINVDEDPCLFPDCGHVFTLSSMDSHMSMKDHYGIDPATGAYMSTKGSSAPFSSEELKVCPECRGSLRNLAHYGRIVRRVILDENTKKLTLWSTRTHQQLSERLLADQERLMRSVDTTKRLHQYVRIGGSVKDQKNQMTGLKNLIRYRQTFGIRRAIQQFADKLRKDEQPYQRVHDLVETVRRQNTTPAIEPFEFASTELQLREHLQAIALLIRCDIIILSDVIKLHDSNLHSPNESVLQVHFGANRTQCEELINEAVKTFSVRQEAEGHIFWARFAAMECASVNATVEGIAPGALHLRDVLNGSALEQLRNAEDICERLPDPTAGLMNEVLEVRRMLNEGTSSSEMLMVVTAMAADPRGNVRWYYCANGHPFTVGECGMPMQLARCYHCGAGVGGQSHRPTEGVTHAHDIEDQLRRMDI